MLKFLYRENMNKSSVQLQQKTNKTLNDGYQKQTLYNEVSKWAQMSKPHYKTRWFIVHVYKEAVVIRHE